jgi:hypothetical protein
VVRLVRVARVFKILQSKVNKSKHSDEEEDKTSPSRLGVVLSDAIAKRIVLIVLTLIIAVPYLSVDRITDATVTNVLLLNCMEQMTVSQVKNASRTIMDTQDYPIFYMEVKGNVIINDTGIAPYIYLRSFEYIIDEGSDPTQNTTILLSQKEQIMQESVFHMLMVFVVIFVFAVGSWIVSRDAHLLVVKPIERMTVMIRKLAGTICVLSSADEPNKVNEENLEENETKMLESVVGKIAAIFDVKQDDASATAKNKTKAERMLTGSKMTQVISNGSVFNVNVVENTEAVGVPASNLGSSPKYKADGAPMSQHSLQVSDLPELKSMETIMRHSEASKFLKLYLASHLQIENYLFWMDCEKFNVQYNAFAKRIVVNFIEEGSPQQVNIEAKMREATVKTFYDGSVTIDLFSKAQAEIYKVLNQNNFNKFIQSEFCKEYLKKKEDDEKAEVVAQMALLEGSEM